MYLIKGKIRPAARIDATTLRQFFEFAGTPGKGVGDMFRCLRMEGDTVKNGNTRWTDELFEWSGDIFRCQFYAWEKLAREKYNSLLLTTESFVGRQPKPLDQRVPEMGCFANADPALKLLNSTWQAYALYRFLWSASWIISENGKAGRCAIELKFGRASDECTIGFDKHLEMLEGRAKAPSLIEPDYRADALVHEEFGSEPIYKYTREMDFKRPANASLCAEVLARWFELGGMKKPDFHAGRITDAMLAMLDEMKSHNASVIYFPEFERH